MKYFFLISLILAFMSFGHLSEATTQPNKNELWLMRKSESGVIQNLLVNYFGRYQLHDHFDLLLGGSWGFEDHPGLALLGVGGELKWDEAHEWDWGFRIGMGVQHERWSSWMTTENRVILYATFLLFRAIKATVGYGYRSPQFQSLDLKTSLSWPGNNAEFNPLYRFEWSFLNQPLWRESSFRMAFMLWNYDRMRLYTFDNIHLSINPELNFTKKTKLQFMLGTAMKGTSGAIISFGQSFFQLGVTHEYE